MNCRPAWLPTPIGFPCQAADEDAKVYPTRPDCEEGEAARFFPRRKCRTAQSDYHMKNGVWRAIVEVGFIIFLFYSNLLMGEMERTASGRDKGLLWDLHDIFTQKNFIVAVIAGMVGYLLVERLRDGSRNIRRKQ
jgi:hypothetical protein